MSNQAKAITETGTPARGSHWMGLFEAKRSNCSFLHEMTDYQYSMEREPTVIVQPASATRCWVSLIANMGV